MLALLAFAIVVAAAWRMSYWPFDGTYKFLPKYGEAHPAKSASATGSKPAE